MLGQSTSVPEDASALVIAGPQKELSPGELDVLRDYLERQGRLLLLLDAATTSAWNPCSKNGGFAWVTTWCWMRPAR